jgi:hypothetical protein
VRIRTVKPEFFLHEALFEAEKQAKLPLRLAFIGLWCAADREGRFKWEPRRLGVSILPYDACDFSRVLDALCTRGFVRKYRVADADFGVIPSFGRHQVINNREKASELPEPSVYLTLDATGTRDSREEHAGKAEGKGREGEQGVNKNKARCTEEEAVAYAIERGIPEKDGSYCFNRWEAAGWLNGGHPIRDWKATMRSWWDAGYLPSQKPKPPQINGSNGHKQRQESFI